MRFYDGLRALAEANAPLWISDEDIEQMLRDFEPYNSWRMEVSMERVNLMLAQVSKAKAEQESRAGE